MLIDTHVHLNNEALYEDVENYIKKAQNENVTRFIVIGYNPEMNEKAIALAEKYDFVYASVGMHPTYVKDHKSSDIELFVKQLDHKKVVAVGECGLDYHWDKDNKTDQKRIFERQIELSKALDLPLSIHMRDATEDTYEVLKRYAPLKGIMHCYSGSKEFASKFLELGLHISLGGPVTFKNAKVPKDVAKLVPLDKLLIETDAPFLAPHPYRGKQNDSSYLPLIAQAIAALKEVSFETIATHTTKNAKTLFNLE